MEFDKGNFLIRMWKMILVFILFIVVLFKIVYELSIVFESRVFGVSKKRIFLRDFEMKFRDYVVFVFFLVGFFLVFYVCYVFGFGYVNFY